MDIPKHSYQPGKQVGMLVRHTGAFVTKSVCYHDNDGNFRRANIHIHNQPVWYWTGYRWIRFGSNNATESIRDRVRYQSSRKVVNNEWV